MSLLLLLDTTGGIGTQAVTQQQQLSSPVLTQHNILAVDGLAQGQSLSSVTFSLLNIASVDSDNTIFDGQTGVVILPSVGTTFAASGNRVFIEQSSVTVEQTVTAEGTSSITFTVDLTGITSPGQGLVRVAKPT